MKNNKNTLQERKKKQRLRLDWSDLAVSGFRLQLQLVLVRCRYLPSGGCLWLFSAALTRCGRDRVSQTRFARLETGDLRFISSTETGYPESAIAGKLLPSSAGVLIWRSFRLALGLNFGVGFVWGVTQQVPAVSSFFLQRPPSSKKRPKTENQLTLIDATLEADRGWLSGCYHHLTYKSAGQEKLAI